MRQYRNGSYFGSGTNHKVYIYGIISNNIGIISNMLNQTALNIMEQFFYSGLGRLQTAKIIRKTGYDFKTIKKYLKDLERSGLIKEHRDLNIPTYEANYRDKYFLNIKREKMLNDIFDSGLPGYFHEQLGEIPCILFGSCVRGDYYENSDIDVFIQSRRIEIPLSPFEKKLKRKINLFFEEKWQNLNEGMKTGLLNDGISINGRLKL
jgi:predicted nucleotidyltransferase/predicted transcriptional regulator